MNDAAGYRGRAVGRARDWLAGRTLRARLVAGVLVLLAVACAAVGTATYAGVRTFLIRQLDRQLVAASQRYTDCVSHVLTGDPGSGSASQAGARDPGPEPGGPGRGPSPEDCAEQQAQQTLIAAVSRGSLSYDYLTAGRCRLSTTDKVVLTSLPTAGTPFTTTLSNLGTYRLVAAHDPGGQATYVTGLPMAPVSDTLHSLELAEVLVFSVALLLTGVLGLSWVRLSLRPLRRVAATATQVTMLPLASGTVTLPERVPVADSRTEVGQLGAAFNRMLGHVESSLARRAASEGRLRRFAADASHELRTPLASIRGYAELARRSRDPVPADVAHALARVESESARMSVLVDELLLLAQLDAGRPLAREQVDMTRLAIDAASDARVATPTHRWQLDLPDEPVHVVGDEHRLRQVLANVLANAAKHTPPGTSVTVALTPEADARALTVSVTDDGPGIPADLQESLFERFVRGDSARTHSTGGTGLGLAIVAAVTAAHGGTVRVSSEPGHTQFDVTLPYAPALSAGRDS